MDDDNIPANAICYLNSARGIYIPQNFFQITKPECIIWNTTDSSQKDWVLNSCASPDDCDYWEAWDWVEQNVHVKNPETGVICYLYHQEDLWLIPVDPAEMAEVNKTH